MCDCAEERARREALERKRRLEGDATVARGSSSSGGGGLSWYSVLGGTLLMALFAIAAKTAADPNGWAKPLYIMLGLQVDEDPGPCGIRISEGKRRWPLEDNKE